MIKRRVDVFRAVAFLGLLLLFTFSCKKLDKKNPIEINIKAHIPYNGMPVVGIKYTIKEYRSKKYSKKMGDTEWTDFTVEGRTGKDGLAHISFLPKKSLDYQYHIYFDYSEMDIPGYNGAVKLVNAPQFDVIARNDSKNYVIRALPNCEVHYKIENVNCFDVNDKMRFKMYNMDESPYITSFQSMELSWSDYFNGCGLHSETTNNNSLSGRQLYQIEVTRNNVVTTYIDTFFLQPGIMNEVFLEY